MIARSLVMALVLIAGCDGPERERTTDVAEALGGEESAGYARAFEPREVHFPADHGPHPDYRNEWWYVTGNLRNERGERYGFQLTIFRIALSAEPPMRASRWGTRQLYMAHLAITDVTGRRFHAFDRFSREALGLAGARLDPFAVWLEDWTLHAERGSAFPWRLQAAEQGLALDLRLTPTKPPVLQGERGLSQKSSEPGNASYYYSLTRLQAEGRLVLEGRAQRVAGTAWLDREWSTSALGEGQTGWDWFALQLDDGTDIMYYQLRREDGGIDPHSAGSAVLPNGEVVPLRHDHVRLTVLDWWESPRGGRYPVSWRMAIPSLSTTLTITPALTDQELAVTVRYWEGAIDIRGERDHAPVNGWGYMELTGYASGDTGLRGKR